MGAAFPARLRLQLRLSTALRFAGEGACVVTFALDASAAEQIAIGIDGQIASARPFLACAQTDYVTRGVLDAGGGSHSD